MMNFRDLIPNIVEGLDLKTGSLMLLHFWGENEDLDILDKFSLELGKNGVLPLKWQYSQEFLKDYYSASSSDALEFPEKYFEIFDKVDGVIDICMYTPPHLHKDFPREKLPFYGKYMGQLMERLQTKETFIQIKVPTEANAALSKFSFEKYKEAMLGAYNINYSEVKAKCSNLIEMLNEKKEVKIVSNDDSILTFSLENREWLSDHGNGDIPCGEIYIAPNETSCNGSILIPSAFIDDTKYSNLKLSFENGKLITCSENEVFEYIKCAPGDSDILGEFGIGLNPAVKELIGYIALDEKAIGTVHIAVGMNDMFGGVNSSPLHLDFVLTPKKIEFDGEELLSV